MHEKTLSTKTVYAGRILSLEVQEVELPSGKRVPREVVRHIGAVAVLARMEDGRFVLVRQFRKAVERVMVEIVAGLREPGEDAETCARRELREETGLEALRLVHLGPMYPTPGYVDERIDLYFAEAGNGGDPSPDEDEHLEVICLDRDQIIGMILRNEIVDSKTLAAWLKYELLVEGRAE